MIWTTDLILNLEEKRLSVRLDQETTERTSSFLSFFPTIFYQNGDTEGYAGMDGRLPVWENLWHLESGKKRTGGSSAPGKEHFQLPVVYVTKKWDGTYPLHVKRLSNCFGGRLMY